ncbi:MAG: DUF2298 domain-containing protein, partial [Chloroflexi bacterium]|nr:DUF2298 domain-containing protein [Chloroflexota bacterium]
RKSFWALAGAIVLLVASNGAGVVLAFERLLQVAPTTWLRALGGTTAGSTDPWWWWAGRAFTDQNIFGRLPEIISEFPAFSFLLGDLHPHLLSLPYVLLVIGAAIEIMAATQAAPWWRSAICWLSPLLIGALGWINSWDLPTFGMLIPLIYFIYRLRWQTLGQTAKETLSYVLYLLSAILLFIPFYIGLTTQVKGLGTTYYTKTGIGQLLLTFGALLVPLVIYFLRSRTGRLRHLLLIWIGILILPWVLTAVIGSGGRTLLGLGITLQRGPWVILILSGCCALAVEGLLSKQKTNAETDIRPLICLPSLFGCALLYIVEFFYISDIFNSRMNTYFKLSYHAWILLVIAAVLAIWQLASSSSGKKWAGIFAGGLLLILCMYAPLTAASIADAASVPTLDGAAYLNQLAPEEYGAITWLQEHAARGEIMVEAASQDYSQGNRVSAFSGVPTLLGWPGHERQWRGSGEIVRERQDIVRTLYTSTDKSKVLELLQDNHINYLYISPREMRSYGFGSERIAWYSSFLQPVYSAGDTALFQVP